MDKIYLDNNATAKMNEEVREAIFALPNLPYNASSIHSYGREARKIIENSRISLAESIGISNKFDDYRIIFTSSGTEANNIVINNFKDNNIVISSIEHMSILEPASLAKNTHYLPVDNNGNIDANSLENILKNLSGKILLSIIYANNETGIIQDIKSLTILAHKYNAIIHVDAVQAYGKIAIDLVDLDVDLVTLSAHKVGGMIGAAALIFKRGIAITSQIKGGKQELGYRAGTENILAIYGFGVVAKLIDENIKKIKKIKKIRDRMEQEILIHAEDAIIVSMKQNRLDNTSMIIMPGISSQTQLISFDLANIAVSSGSACASGKIGSSHVLKAMQIEENMANCAIRISFGYYNNESETDIFINEWKKIYDRTKNLN